MERIVVPFDFLPNRTTTITGFLGCFRRLLLQIYQIINIFGIDGHESYIHQAFRVEIPGP